MTMTVSRRIGGLFSGLCLVLMVGCVTEAETPPAAADDVEDEANPKAERHAEHMRRGAFGPTAMLTQTALAELDLTSEQQSALEGALDTLGPTEEGMEAHRELQAAVAAGLRAGALDDELIAEKLAAVKERIADANERTVAALDLLHDTLSAEERGNLVAIVRERGEAMRERFEKKAEDGDEDGDHHHKGHKAHKGGHEGKGMWFTRGLDLTDEQKTALRAKLDEAGVEKPSREAMGERFAAMREKMSALLDAFAADDFEAASFRDTITFDAMEKGFDHHLTMMKALAGILDETQRNELADRIERGPHEKKD
jgi:hypothetical protein